MKTKIFCRTIWRRECSTNENWKHMIYLIWILWNPCLLKKNAFNVKMYIENTYTVPMSNDNILCKGKNGKYRWKLISYNRWSIICIAIKEKFVVDQICFWKRGLFLKIINKVYNVSKNDRLIVRKYTR